jgi:hypothetical protein
METDGGTLSRELTAAIELSGMGSRRHHANTERLSNGDAALIPTGDKE